MRALSQALFAADVVSKCLFLQGLRVTAGEPRGVTHSLRAELAARACAVPVAILRAESSLRACFVTARAVCVRCARARRAALTRGARATAAAGSPGSR